MKIRTRLAAAAVALTMSVGVATSAAAEVPAADATVAHAGFARAGTPAVLGDFVRSLPAMDTGDSGYQVLGLQMVLRHNGHPEISGTGYFGPVTAAAVQDVQRANGITASGHVGVQTWTALTGHLRDGCYDPSVIADPSLMPGDALDDDSRYALSAISWATNVFDWAETIGSYDKWMAKDTYDDDWVTQIAAIQFRSGIPASGIYGPRTAEAVEFLNALSSHCVS